MSRAGQIQTIVAGEASESDEDDGQQCNPPEQSRNTQGDKSRPGVVVSGEASESEDEVDESMVSSVTPLRVDESGKGDVVPESDSESINESSQEKPTTKVHMPPKYDTVLHHKLREKNAGLHGHMQEFVANMYSKSAKDIRAMGQQLSKSQQAVQEVSHSMSLLTNDLFHLEDKIDIVATCNILPEIDIELPPSAAASGGDSKNSSAKSSPSR